MFWWKGESDNSEIVLIAQISGVDASVKLLRDGGKLDKEIRSLFLKQGIKVKEKRTLQPCFNPTPTGI